jgi:hypothetical protein
MPRLAFVLVAEISHLKDTTGLYPCCRNIASRVLSMGTNVSVVATPSRMTSRTALDAPTNAHTGVKGIRARSVEEVGRSACMRPAVSYNNYS